MLNQVGSRPLENVPQTRSVYLPGGADWYDFWTGRTVLGWPNDAGRCAHQPAAINVRAGCILPMGPVRQHIDDLPEAPLELHIYPGQDGSFELYEDEATNIIMRTARFR